MKIYSPIVIGNDEITLKKEMKKILMAGSGLVNFGVGSMFSDEAIQYMEIIKEDQILDKSIPVKKYDPVCEVHHYEKRGGEWICKNPKCNKKL